MLVVHPLKPIFDERSRVLFLGTMPSPKSRQAQFYYAHPQNRFWRVLTALFGENIPPDNFSRKNFALNHHIALWDVLHSCEIEGASDASIKNPVPHDISIILNAAPIGAIFCTGTKSWSFYHDLIEPVCKRSAFRLPSTSPANCVVPFEQLCHTYSVILQYL